VSISHPIMRILWGKPAQNVGWGCSFWPNMMKKMIKMMSREAWIQQEEEEFAEIEAIIKDLRSEFGKNF